MRAFTWVILLAFTFTACKEQTPQVLPRVRVNFTVQLNLPEFSSLRLPGNIYYKQYVGVDENGVYVVHSLTGDQDFAAYDATCVRHLENLTRTDLIGSTALCPVCDTEYQLLNEGISTDGNYRLQPYRIIKHGTDNLLVTNIR